MIVLDIPRAATSMLYFVLVGVVTSKWKDMRTYFMMFSTIPPFAGFLLMAFLPNELEYKWAKWGSYFITFPFVITLFLAWTLIPSNVAGRTKRTLTSSFTFVGYCLGNMTGSQIFKASDAPRYIPGIIGCAVCFGLQFLVIAIWRVTLVLRNRRRAKMMLEQGVTEEERIKRGMEFGEKDSTDFKNPYVSTTRPCLDNEVGSLLMRCSSFDIPCEPLEGDRRRSHAVIILLHGIVAKPSCARYIIVRCSEINHHLELPNACLLWLLSCSVASEFSF